jgi:hypothetical protein
MERIFSLSSPEFSNLFLHYRRSAFRLEVLQEYAVGYEDKPFQDFLLGKPRYTDKVHQAWIDLIKSSKASGKSMSRVHIINEPLTDYLKFELLWPYRDNVDAGDEIHLVVCKDGLWPSSLPRQDFWLFDDNLVADMIYDDSFGFVQAVLSNNPDVINQRKSWRDEALRLSMPYGQYMKTAVLS